MTPEIEISLAKLNQLSKKEQEDFRINLEKHINWMIVNCFEQLVQLLYRLDVDEIKLKTMLSQNQEKDAAHLITSLIIERQLQKLASRKQGDTDPNIPDEERW